MMKSKETAYYAKHEKADTRIIYYVGQQPNRTNAVMKTVDTNVVVIVLGFFHQLDTP